MPTRSSEHQPNTMTDPACKADLFSLEGKVAMITGGSGGIGKRVAAGMAAVGACVILVDTNAESLSQATADFRSGGLRALGVPLDVTDAQAVETAVAKLWLDPGPIDILVNCAGINARMPSAEFDLAKWQRVLDVNLTGTFVCCQAVGKRMILRGNGRIINVASLLAHIGTPNLPAYAASKGGVAQLTRVLAVEWGRYGVRVNGLTPGYIQTAFNAHVLGKPEFRETVLKCTSAGRYGTPDDLVGPAIFLASAASDFVNGHILVVDGGFLAGNPSIVALD